MIMTKPDGKKYGDNNIDHETNHLFICPKCGCVHQIADIESLYDKEGRYCPDNIMLCNECGTELDLNLPTKL